MATRDVSVEITDADGYLTIVAWEYPGELFGDPPGSWLYDHETKTLTRPNERGTSSTSLGGLDAATATEAALWEIVGRSRRIRRIYRLSNTRVRAKALWDIVKAAQKALGATEATGGHYRGGETPHQTVAAPEPN